MDDVEPGSTGASISGADPPVDVNNQQQQNSTSMDGPSQTCDTGTACAISVTTPNTVSTGLAIGLRSFYGKNSRNRRKPVWLDD